MLDPSLCVTFVGKNLLKLIHVSQFVAMHVGSESAKVGQNMVFIKEEE